MLRFLDYQVTAGRAEIVDKNQPAEASPFSPAGHNGRWSIRNPRSPTNLVSALDKQPNNRYHRAAHSFLLDYPRYSSFYSPIPLIYVT